MLDVTLVMIAVLLSVLTVTLREFGRVRATNRRDTDRSN